MHDRVILNEAKRSEESREYGLYPCSWLCLRFFVAVLLRMTASLSEVAQPSGARRSAVEKSIAISPALATVQRSVLLTHKSPAANRGHAAAAIMAALSVESAMEGKANGQRAPFCLLPETFAAVRGWPPRRRRPRCCAHERFPPRQRSCAPGRRPRRAGTRQSGSAFLRRRAAARPRALHRECRQRLPVARQSALAGHASAHSAGRLSSIR